jgi:energy-coupling factor transport system substrate-specific component
VSWELVSFLILAAVLVAGFVWYERSRPPAQVVALVAALAALAIVGRIAFAAFPNVKPTTDIVIFAGYALGGAPGFAVGALAALVSNFWFGQGPWTPWQMAGWGLCGILGAALALGIRNAGRLGLAATCGLAGALYGALMNFSLMATYGGDLSWQRLGVLEARAIPFEIAHVAGNVVLALVAGPAMVRMLARFRERFEWGRGGAEKPGPGSGSPGGLTPALRGAGVVAVILLALAPAALAPTRADASEASRAAGWLVSAQNEDGGFGASPGDDSGAETTCWAMLGLEAAGRNPLDVSRGGKTPVDFLRAGAGKLKSPGELARTILALEGAGVDPRKFGGQNLVAKLLGTRLDDGSYEDWPNSTAFAVIALRAAGASGGLEKSLDWLRQAQNDDGGWGDTPNTASNPDGTAAVLQALAPGSKGSGNGLSFLKQVQRPGGGFALRDNDAVNTQSTAWALQGIVAAGADPESVRRGGSSAVEFLAKQQQADGHYRYSGSSDQTPVWVTGQALVAATGKYFPIAAPARAPAPPPIPASSAIPGGIPTSPLSPPPTVESPVVPPSESTASGGGGSPPGHSASSGQGSSGSPSSKPPGVASGRGLAAPAPEEPSGSVNSTDSTLESSAPAEDKTSAAVAAAMGLLAGCLLFGAAWAGRRVWMRQRYGV